MKKLLLLLLFYPVLLQAQIWTLASGESRVVPARGQSYITVVTDSDSATGVLTASDLINTETVTIDSIAYLVDSGDIDTAYDVDLGGTLTVTLSNLCAAINLTGVAGTTYGAGTAIHPTVTCTASDATTLTIAAKVGGSDANTIATTETSGTAAWGDTTLVDAADATATISRVDSISATSHTAPATAVTGTTPTASTFAVDWPFFFVSTSSGGARVAVAR